MKIRVFPFRRLSPEHVSAWSEIQMASAECDSPYFRPEFHQLAADVGRPVMVGVMEQGDRPVGFFPFERGSFGAALPVGLRLSDFHGAIVAHGVEWSGRELLRGCGLRRFVFDHLPTTQSPLITGPALVEPSPLIDLTPGFAAYRQQIKQRGEKELERTIKKREKMERELGPATFRFHEPVDAAINACVQWKTAQYERTGVLNVFRSPWVVDLLRRIARSDWPHFSGSVSTLYVGEELVAVHVGMRTASVLHHWFPTHNVEHSCVKHSPGLQLLVAMIEASAESGIHRIDFGKGEYRYKRDFGTGASEVAEGICGGGAMELALARSMKGARSWLRNTAERAGIVTPVRWYRQMRDWLVMR